ncbi:hypothetical protein C5167_004048 [Papaver somniferum]|nr:hypothetical protein C5167_004048 [Papaver somniferum]
MSAYSEKDNLSAIRERAIEHMNRTLRSTVITGSDKEACKKSATSNSNFVKPANNTSRPAIAEQPRKEMMSEPFYIQS